MVQHHRQCVSKSLTVYATEYPYSMLLLELMGTQLYVIRLMEILSCYDTETLTRTKYNCTLMPSFISTYTSMVWLALFHPSER